jgi:hypothetical protein
MPFFHDILDVKRSTVLDECRAFKKDFYLAGGTALALRIGHRDSFDFDFFHAGAFDTARLFARVKKAFSRRTIRKIQEEENTLTVLVDGVKISFFGYPYPLLKKTRDIGAVRLASCIDIGCMKCAAIVGRATMKDYVDLYYILQEMPLPTLLCAARKKLPQLDRNLILKSIVYFKDVADEPIRFKNGKQVSLETVKKFLIRAVKELPMTD